MPSDKINKLAVVIGFFFFFLILFTIHPICLYIKRDVPNRTFHNSKLFARFTYQIVVVTRFPPTILIALHPRRNSVRERVRYYIFIFFSSVQSMLVRV